jgi:PEP-CTERM motif
VTRKTVFLGAAALALAMLAGGLTPMRAQTQSGSSAVRNTVPLSQLDARLGTPGPVIFETSLGNSTPVPISVGGGPGCGPGIPGGGPGLAGPESGRTHRRPPPFAPTHPPCGPGPDSPESGRTHRRPPPFAPVTPPTAPPTPSSASSNPGLLPGVTDSLGSTAGGVTLSSTSNSGTSGGALNLGADEGSAGAAPTPEPASMILFGSGLVAAGMAKRKLSRCGKKS